MTKTALVVAGSEATGGAGIQVDLRTFDRLGVFGAGAITCIVSFDPNNGWGHRFVPIAPEVIEQQIEAATACRNVEVVKIGMLGTVPTVEAVTGALSKQPWRHVVLDPVLICKGQEPGAALDTDTALRNSILPLATVITPNYFEACTLAGMDELNTVEDLEEAARRIHAQGPRYVVVKGGMDFPGPDAVDVLFDGENMTVFAEPKIGDRRVSGAGCTFAAVITAELAKSDDVAAAVAQAKSIVTEAIYHAEASNAPFTSVGMWHAND